MNPVAAQRDSVLAPARPFEWLTGIPKTLAGSARDVTRRSRLGTVAAAVASTGVLIAYDQQIFDETRRFGGRIDLSSSHPVSALWVGSSKLFYMPTTISSGLYYLGDGWTTMLVAGTYYVTGKVRGDNRAVCTASEITESMFALGIVTQTLKHATGRQTPGTATEPRGAWHPFVKWSEYSRNTPRYDAMPSGHLATAMATVTVIAANYPDSRWVKPIGYSLMGGLAFTMVNDGVHWVSDYPLALLIGGTIGKIAAERGHVLTPAAIDGRVEPLVSTTGVGLRVRW